MSRFDYVKYDAKALVLQGKVKALFELTEEYVTALTDSRTKSAALTKLEEAYMWIGKAIRDDQVARGVPNAD